MKIRISYHTKPYQNPRAHSETLWIGVFETEHVDIASQFSLKLAAGRHLKITAYCSRIIHLEQSHWSQIVTLKIVNLKGFTNDELIPENFVAHPPLVLISSSDNFS